MALSFLFILVPRKIRDGFYDYVAKNRYKWFGMKEDACMLPPPEMRKRFILRKRTELIYN